MHANNPSVSAARFFRTERCNPLSCGQVKLVDTQTLEVLKVFATDRPANAAALSPILDQARGSPGPAASSLLAASGMPAAPWPPGSRGCPS